LREIGEVADFKRPARSSYGKAMTILCLVVGLAAAAISIARAPIDNRHDRTL